jgi:hypothetical protein
VRGEWEEKVRVLVMDRGQMGRKFALTESSCSEAAIYFGMVRQGD